MKRFIVLLSLLLVTLVLSGCGGGATPTSSSGTNGGSSVPPCPTPQPGDTAPPTRVTALYCNAYPAEVPSGYSQDDFVRDVEAGSWKFDGQIVTESGSYEEAKRFCVGAKKNPELLDDPNNGVHKMLALARNGNEDIEVYIAAIRKTCV